MAHYRVWTVDTKPEQGKVVAAKSSIEARQACANAWGIPLGRMMARREDKDPALLAAAPDLLAELRETLRDLTEWDGTPDALEVIKANIAAAITKAEGRQQ